MKTDYIYDMPAGKEMDTLVAEKVMGLCAHDWKLIPNDDDGVCRICQKCHLEFWGLRPPVYGAHYGSYSTDISAAWEVVERMNKQYGADIEIISHHPKNDCIAHFWNCDPNMSIEHIMDDFVARADTVPLAICRGALLAIEHELE